MCKSKPSQRLKAIEEQMAREWRFYIRRFRPHFPVTFIARPGLGSLGAIGAVSPLAGASIAFEPWLPEAERRAAIARAFGFIARVSTPEGAAQVRQEMRELSAWGKGGPKPDWCKTPEERESAPSSDES